MKAKRVFQPSKASTLCSVDFFARRLRAIIYFVKLIEAIQKGRTCDSEAEPSSMDIDTAAQTRRSTNTGQNVFTGQSNFYKTFQPFCMIVSQRR